ncbi:hydrogenase nickel incorporation protein HypB [Legionella brunensis]|uniref:Hydrogenase maturation factor HypB n=1 Tax=Legionella brunensis TaxID=29422 RepID=A0A0W0STF8_9GAMM|nr:hydrogenase nickel incorporation protein HypB [Legionella brunensis]KTC86564.1 hydrogenase expression/formation protein HypB [Legionella brunensis]
MCGLCGCSEEDNLSHHNSESTLIAHHHHHASSKMVQVEQDLLSKNDQFALANRHTFLKNKIIAINLMSSPGSGKTTLLVRTISDLKNQISIAVVVGDQQTDYDAEKIKSTGAQAIQINTGKVCHLDAHMVGHSLETLVLQEGNILFIENVGNLVCPALFDLGETYRIVILSVTEGDNKPLKYPEMFRKADLLILTKTDLLPYVEFDVYKCLDYARRINPSVEACSLSARTGEGLMSWYEWLAMRQF